MRFLTKISAMLLMFRTFYIGENFFGMGIRNYTVDIPHLFYFY